MADGRGILAGVARLGRPDVIYERYSLGHQAGLDCAHRLGIPFVLEVNAPLVAEAFAHRPETLSGEDGVVERRLFVESDLVAVVSDPLKSIVARARGTERGVVVIPNGCDPDRFRVPPHRTDGRIRLAFLGHPKPWHGAAALPGLVAALRTAGLDVDLLVIGDGHGVDELIERAEGLGVSPFLRVTGAVPENLIPQLLADSDILVAPYPRQRPFYFCPLKVIEGMAAGLPVVTTAQGDLPGMLGDAGVTVTPGDDVAFLRAVADLIRDPDRRRRLGEAGRCRVRERFSWVTAGQALDSALDLVMGRAR